MGNPLRSQIKRIVDLSASVMYMSTLSVCCTCRPISYGIYSGLELTYTYLYVSPFSLLSKAALNGRLKGDGGGKRGLTCTHAFATCCVSVCALQTPRGAHAACARLLVVKKRLIFLFLLIFPDFGTELFIAFGFALFHLLLCRHDNIYVPYVATGSSGEISKLPPSQPW